MCPHVIILLRGERVGKLRNEKSPECRAERATSFIDLAGVTQREVVRGDEMSETGPELLETHSVTSVSPWE